MHLISFSFTDSDEQNQPRVYGSTVAQMALTSDGMNEVKTILRASYGNSAKPHNIEYLPGDDELLPVGGKYRYWVSFAICVNGAVDIQSTFVNQDRPIQTLEDIRELEEWAKKTITKKGKPLAGLVRVALTACKPAD